MEKSLFALEFFVEQMSNVKTYPLLRGVSSLCTGETGDWTDRQNSEGSREYCSKRPPAPRAQSGAFMAAFLHFGAPLGGIVIACVERANRLSKFSVFTFSDKFSFE